MRRAAALLLLPAFFCACAGPRPNRAPLPVQAAAAAQALPGPELSDEAFLEDLEHRTFRFFWERAVPKSGLIPDRWPTKSFSSIAAVGFALTAYPIGAERGYVTRAQAAERALETLRFLYDAPQGPEAAGRAGYRGFFYHFLDMDSGTRFKDVELSTIDTALLMAGVLFCREYFDRSDAREKAVRDLADRLYRRVEWDWPRPNTPLVNMGWDPEKGFKPLDWRGYDESMILYILALGSPTHPVEPSAWSEFTKTYVWGPFQGLEFLQFGPLYGHQYSHIWIDFRGIQDAYMKEKGIDYFENSRRAAYAHRSYAQKNPGGFAGYDRTVWGITACDGPADKVLAVHGATVAFHTYAGRAAGATWTNDDGTLAPTGAGGMIPFAPEIAVPALREMVRRYGADLYSEYGFLDAFNPSFTFADAPPQMGRVVPGKGWFGTDYLGIDQGPLLAMAENRRSGLIWKALNKSPYILEGLRRAGFTGGRLGP
ncbi:MAG: glucoamylase family protein [Elusimicrobiota bacterium]|jgi:hypothetical protein